MVVDKKAARNKGAAEMDKGEAAMDSSNQQSLMRVIGISANDNEHYGEHKSRRGLCKVQQLMWIGLAVVSLCCTPALASGKINKSTCSFNGHPLYGKVQFVEHFPDVKIQVVDNFPDLKVKLVKSFPDDCGEWQVVEHFPDVKVQIVEHFPDVRIKFVKSFPGIK